MQNELQNEEDEADDESSSIQSNSLLSIYDEIGIGSPTSGEGIREPHSLKEQTTNRRKKVEEGLKNRRYKKLSSKLSMDTQSVKKPEGEFNSVINRVFKSMENIKFLYPTNSWYTSSPCQTTANTLSETISAPF